MVNKIIIPNLSFIISLMAEHDVRPSAFSRRTRLQRTVSLLLSSKRKKTVTLKFKLK